MNTHTLVANLLLFLFLFAKPLAGNEIRNLAHNLSEKTPLSKSNSTKNYVDISSTIVDSVPRKDFLWCEDADHHESVFVLTAKGKAHKSSNSGKTWNALQLETTGKTEITEEKTVYFFIFFGTSKSKYQVLGTILFL